MAHAATASGAWAYWDHGYIGPLDRDQRDYRAQRGLSAAMEGTRGRFACRGSSGERAGLGVRWPKVFWFWTGGDSYLGRSIPIYAFGTAAGTARVAPAINFAIGGNDVADGLPEFSLVRCWTGDDGNVCLARAERGKVCTPDPNFDLNSVPGLGFVGTDFGADH